MRNQYPAQEIRFELLEGASLEEIIGLEPPPGVEDAQAFRQLRKIDEYVRDSEIGAQTVVIEKHYIDRDFMEDYSIFYSRSLLPYHNYCCRVHFFRGAKAEVEDHINELLAQGLRVRGNTDLEDAFRRACLKVSSEKYCGFSVIKPLPGTPVGRTVLRTFPGIPEGNTPSAKRYFAAAREYRTHLLGLELSVRGLAFQQQDVGVAACATTAIWVALQKTRETEELGPTTPAHITTKATQSRLPFGRSMPSEGLSIDQMSQAIDSFGLSPVLTRVDSFRAARVELFSAAYSGLTPVIVIRKLAGTQNRHHAVTVVGIRMSAADPGIEGGMSLEADRLEAVYIHDDRNGPYLLAKLEQTGTGALDLSIRTKKAPRLQHGTSVDEYDKWMVTHLLTPMHAKIRLSISELYRLATDLAATIGAALQTLRGQSTPTHTLRLSLRVLRSHRYLEDLLLREESTLATAAQDISRKIPLARYLGIIRFEIVGAATLEILVDTTSTFRNPAYLACICGDADKDALEVSRSLADALSCQFLGAK